jgi:hypothetical protein
MNNSISSKIDNLINNKKNFIEFTNKSDAYDLNFIKKLIHDYITMNFEYKSKLYDIIKKKYMNTKFKNSKNIENKQQALKISELNKSIKNRYLLNNNGNDTYYSISNIGKNIGYLLPKLDVSSNKLIVPSIDLEFKLFEREFNKLNDVNDVNNYDNFIYRLITVTDRELNIFLPSYNLYTKRLTMSTYAMPQKRRSPSINSVANVGKLQRQTGGNNKSKLQTLKEKQKKEMDKLKNKQKNELLKLKNKQKKELETKSSNNKCNNCKKTFYPKQV